MSPRAIIDWDEAGAPRSRRFDDVYFSRAGGLQEARAVFLEGCGLPGAWAGRERFTVAELGFGTGLNILALLELWQATREPSARLNIFSVEAWPLGEADARRAIEPWPQLAPLAAPLVSGWARTPGFHRIDFPGLNAVLDLAVMEAAEALGAWDGRADAWFLDGFSPARNPEIWREEVLALVAARSAPGARAATFTVAGMVRRGLAAQGFEVARRPGFGGKAERLEARLALRSPARAQDPPRIAIVGAGIAGAALARAFMAEGLVPVVLDAQGPGAGASGNPAALVTPRLDAGGGVPAQLFAQAFERAVGLYADGQPDAVIAGGALQLEAGPRDPSRFDRLAASELFDDGALQRLAPDETGERLGEASGGGALWLRDALVIEPRPVLEAWLDGCDVRRAEVARIEPSGERRRLLGPDGAVLAEADIVCLAAGHSCGALAPLAIAPVRGQASFVRAARRPNAAAWGGYVIPTRAGLLFGATHDRGQSSGELRDEDHARNLATLAQRRPLLAAELSHEPLEGRAGVRASTPDRLPLAGPLEPGLWVLGGLGGRGFCLAPLLAEHIAAGALGLASPLPRHLALALAPDRFSSRSAARAHAGPSEEKVP
jgi:tRNA 5-methylaminomethyl-2-thiouridine biosynthesis bifunctional protein